MSSNYLQSDLSSNLHTYDIVVATTAKAINKTMKRYLYAEGKNATPVEIWYSRPSRGADLEVMDPIADIDPFALGKDDDVPQALSDAHFQFAIKASIGAPDGSVPRNIPDIIQLSEDRQKVQYNLFFHSFEIAERKRDDYGVYINKVVQPKGKPYVFNTLVNLNFSEADPESKFFKELDEATKERLKNLNTSNMFSVQQLYLDLNTAALQALPTIEGLDQDSAAYVTIQTKFINTYWKNLSGSGAVVLGYGVKANTHSDNSSIQPTDLTFNVSPYYVDGNKSDKYKLYTLNYLMMSGGDTLKLGTAFNWNWVSEEEAANVDGAMAIRRAKFADYLKAALATKLPNLCIKPSTHVDGDTFSWSAASSFSKDSSPGTIQKSSQGEEILHFSYLSEAKSDIKKEFVFDSLVADGHFYLTSKSGLTVSVKGDKITIHVEGNMDVYFDPGDAFDTGNVEGRVGGYSSNIVYQVAVDTSGKLTVKAQGDYSEPTLIGDDLDRGIMSGLDGSDDFIGKVRDRYENCTAWAGSFASEIETYLNNSANMWVFPGGQTFTFTDAMFSDNQDLVTHIRYADPN